MSSATNFSLDDLTLAYSEEDYKPQRREPKVGLWFEFKVIEASIGQSKHGYLQLKLVTEAADKNGKAMFKKWVNVPVPVSFGQVVAPPWAKGLWLANVRPLFPEDAPYDRAEKDAITGEKIYWKGDTQVKSGKDYDDAMTASNKAVGKRALEAAKEWLASGDDVDLPTFTGHTVFGKLIHSKDGQYTNIERLLPQAPDSVEICYDSKEAFGK